MAGKIAVLGGGNGAITAAADLTLAGNDVALFEMERFAANVGEILETRTVHLDGMAHQGTARLYQATTRIAEALEGATLILLIVPSLAHRDYARLLARHLQTGQHLVLYPGTFGSLEMLRIMRDQGLTAQITISEADTLPYATRRQGRQGAHVYHALTEHLVGVLPACRTGEVVKLVTEAYPTARAARNVVEAGLSNVNPTLHPLGVLLNVGRIERSRGDFYYYEEGFTDSIARATEALDLERRAIGRRLGLDLPDLATALHAVGYGPRGTLWETINGCRGLTPILGPTHVGNRYLTEDIPIGLSMWASLGRQYDVPTPLMDAVIAIGRVVCQIDLPALERTVDTCGIKGMSAEALADFVHSAGPPRSQR